MNYDEMSDFEINKRVFPHTRSFEKCEDIMQNKNTGRNGFMWGDGANWFEFDPCNNPSDAWPLLLTLIDSGCTIVIENKQVNGELLNGKSITRKIAELYLSRKTD